MLTPFAPRTNFYKSLTQFRCLIPLCSPAIKPTSRKIYSMSIAAFSSRTTPQRKHTAVDKKFISTWAPLSKPMVSDLDGYSSDAHPELPDSPHFKTFALESLDSIDVRLPHPVYTREELDHVISPHFSPRSFADKAAFATVWTLRRAFDFFTGYSLGKKDEACMIRRIVILETIAGVPGMVGAALRHLKSLRRLSRDYGFIHTLLEEAENERMHLMTALLLSNPGRLTRTVIILGQGIFVAWYTLMYAMSPAFCHRFVGYLEEEAVKTYTKIVELIDAGELEGFCIPTPKAASVYWALPDDAPLRDCILAIRADENHHREVNHTFADLVPTPNAINPFPPGH